MAVLVTCGCYNKWPQTWWLRATKICPLGVWETRCLNCLRGLIKVSNRAVLLWEGSRGESLFCLLHLLVATDVLNLWPCHSFASAVNLSASEVTWSSPDLSVYQISFLKGLYLGRVWIIQNNLPISESLSHLENPFCQIRMIFTGSQD